MYREELQEHYKFVQCTFKNQSKSSLIHLVSRVQRHQRRGQLHVFGVGDAEHDGLPDKNERKK